jgi:hypothetical protein
MKLGGHHHRETTTTGDAHTRASAKFLAPALTEA